MNRSSSSAICNTHRMYACIDFWFLECALLLDAHCTYYMACCLLPLLHYTIGSALSNLIRFLFILSLRQIHGDAGLLCVIYLHCLTINICSLCVFSLPTGVHNIFGKHVCFALNRLSMNCETHKKSHANKSKALLDSYDMYMCENDTPKWYRSI